MEYIHFSENLKLIRTTWKMSRSDLAELLNVTKEQLGYYERGEGSVPVKVLLEIEDRTGIVAKRLWYEELAKELIYKRPLDTKDDDIKIELSEVAEPLPPQYSGQKRTLIERVERIEKVLGL